MVIKSKKIEGTILTWILRCPVNNDALELSIVRTKIDSETENLNREVGEDLLTQRDFEKLIHEDSIADRNLFLIAEFNGKILGFARCEGNTLSRFKHKAEFGICILKDYWGNGIGKVLLENILIWTENVGLKKISLNVVETNISAIKLYKQFGFNEEGLLKNDRIHRDGNYYNTVLMSKLFNE